MATGLAAFGQADVPGFAGRQRLVLKILSRRGEFMDDLNGHIAIRHIVRMGHFGLKENYSFRKSRCGPDLTVKVASLTSQTSYVRHR